MELKCEFYNKYLIPDLKYLLLELICDSSEPEAELSAGHSPITRLQGPEGVQRRVHPGEIPELHVVVEASGDQTSAGRIQSQS